MPVPDNAYGLPNATQTGANTFACLINGQKFIAYYDPSYGTGTKIKGDTLGIGGQRKTGGYYEYMGFQIVGNLIKNSNHNIDRVGTYGILRTDSTCLGVSFNETDSYALSGTIQLTKFDTIGKIVSGNFNLVFPIPNCDTLHITDGRFDYHYY